MQILPATGERLATESGKADFQSERLLDPVDNVALGTLYLQKLLSRYGGDLPRGLAAYNAGEVAVDKWQRRYPNMEDDEFVESISYRETRSYVKRVLTNRRIYEALYRPRLDAPEASSR
jgi:soluble lytic murein transglycosylase